MLRLMAYVTIFLKATYDMSTFILLNLGPREDIQTIHNNKESFHLGGKKFHLVLIVESLSLILIMTNH